MREAYNTVKVKANPGDVDSWMKENQKNILLLNKIVTKEPGRRRLNLINTISILKGIHWKFKQLCKVGSGHDRKKLSQRVIWEDLQSVFKGRVRTGVVINLQHKDIERFLEDARLMYIRRVKNVMKKHGNLKVHATLTCKFLKQGEVDIEDTKYFNVKSFEVLPATDLKATFNEKLIDSILTDVQDFNDENSGWTLTEILNISFNFNKFNPLEGAGTNSTFTDLPKSIQNKRAVVNVKNKDEYCFNWAIMSALYPATSNVSLTTSYPHFKQKLKYKGLKYPMELQDVVKFEKMNGLKIHVYGLDSMGEVESLYVSKQKSDKETIHLLMVRSGKRHRETNKMLMHFCWIKNMSRLLSSQINSDQHKTHFCDACLQHYRGKKSYDNHLQNCYELTQCRMILPEEPNNILKFTSYSKKERVPFVVYADIECLLEKVTNDTKVYQKHIPFAIAFRIQCTYNNELSDLKSHLGEDCIKWFLNEMYELSLKVNMKLSIEKDIIMNEEDEENFLLADTCHICEEAFAENDIRIHDHCHLTGKYRGAAHNSCNLNYQIAHFIPIVFHNLSGYDSHFLIIDLVKQFEGQVSVIPINKEKYISFSKEVKGTRIKLRFLDSFKFLPSSIDKLSSILDDSCKKITKSYYSNEAQFHAVTRKGVFPYDYLDSRDKLNDPCLPERSEFFSTLNNAEISDESYNHANYVWELFEIENMAQYSELYLRTDVLLMSDIVENFRDECLQTYGLDPLNYFTAPGLAFDAMLKMTKIKLELLTDPEMMFMVEKSIRGGVAQCSNRYAKANNHYMGELYDKNSPETYIMYYDVNNLYGKSMSLPLPYGGFAWEHVKTAEEIISLPENSEEGYILEVDLQYPESLHKSHSDFPLAPEKLAPPLGSKNKKLLTTLYDKQNYIVHYTNLKLYTDLGLIITKVHRILKFNQSLWLKTYIDLNTNLRTNATSDFKKDFYKLMVNSVFGKTMENKRQHRDVKIVSKWKGRCGAKNLIARPEFHSSRIIAEDVILIELNKTKVNLDVPIYIGSCILDISKRLMYDFYYNYLKADFNLGVQLCYTDTDSFILSFNFDIYEKMKEKIHLFDTSGYPENNVYNMPRVNKKVLGCMKDENNGLVMLEYVGLRAKLYSYKVLGKNDDQKRAKGVKFSALREITFEDYYNCLTEHETLVKEQNLIISKNHEVYSVHQKKIALSWNDDKRNIQDSSFNTIPWGYKSQI